MAPKAPPTVAAKKRKRSKGPTETALPPPQPIASTSTLPPPSVNSVPIPPPLSAVAARRAAALLPNVDLPAHDSAVSEEEDDGEDSDEEELSFASSSSEESDASEKAQSKKRKKKRKKEKARGVGAGRYFGGGNPNEDVERILPAGDSMELYGGTGMEEPASAEGSERPASGKGKMGRGRRQRRERSAFTDPACLSSFVPQAGSNMFPLRWKANAVEASGYLFCMQAGENLIIHGVCSATPIHGSMSLLGTILESPPTPPTLSLPLPPSHSYPFFAPSSHPIPPIESLPSPIPSQETSKLSLKLSTNEEIDLSQYSTVVLISDLVTGIEGVEDILKNGGLGCGNKMWTTDIPSTCGGLTWKLILEPVPSLTLLRTLSSWEINLNRFSQSSNGDGEHHGERLVIMVEGPKRVGKSTFAKLLLNRLLSKYERVAYLDTDLGQPEFTTPGLISLNVVEQPLLGPSFTHLCVPLSAHFLGATSPSSSPSSYLAGIQNLLSLYSLELEYPPTEDCEITPSRDTSHIPLVINTQGWVKGLGADLLNQLKMDARPTHVFAFASEQEENGENGDSVDHANGFAEEADAGGEVAITRMEGAPSSPLDAKWSASDLRTLAFISYFHSSFIRLAVGGADDTRRTNLLPTSWDFSQPLVAKIPYALKWPQNIAKVHIIDNDIPYLDVLRVLDGMIVGVVIDSETRGEEPTSNEDFPYSPSSAPPSPASTQSLGISLIRSIDAFKQTLYVLSPLGTTSLSSLGKVTLVKGKLEAPLSLTLDSAIEVGVRGTEWKDVPFLSVVEGEGGKKKVRRNLMRRSQA